ncbi:restriction endonuclease subunit S [bacterium]|nr:restriction endonuclease subunit S [bacterium]
MPNKTFEKWEEKTLEDILDKGSSNLSANKLNTCEGDYPVYGASGLVKRVNFYQQEKEYLAIIKDGAGVGRVYHYGPKSSILGTLQYLFPKENVNIRFAYYYLQSLDFAKYYQGAAIPHIYYKDYKNEKLVLPPLPEQQRIVKILDEAFENIEKAKQNALQNLNNAKELFESYLTSIFVNNDNWDKKKLSEVAIDFGRGRSRHRPRNDKKLYGGQYPFIQTGEIRNSNHFITEYSQTYNEIGLAQSKLWPKGTLCITIAANIAETGVLTFDACFPDSVIGCVFDETKTNIDYVEYLLQSFKAILQGEGKGSAQDNINLGTFEKHCFPFPDKTKQDEIVDKLNCMRANIVKLEQIYEQKIKDLDELKQSILQKAFNGEL